MTILKPLLLCLPALVLSATAQAVPHPGDPPPGELTALALRQGALDEARAALWQNVAKGINEPGGIFFHCVIRAWGEYQTALATAETRFNARIAALTELGTGRYEPQIRPSQFRPRVDNNYFPLIPGRTLVYEMPTAAGLERIEMRTLRQVTEIDGVRCRAVRSVETLNGEVIEDTIDWYAQHSSGTVWYFGEISKQFEDGFLTSLEGSWRAGQDGAKPGIKMPAFPRQNDSFRMEYLVEEAEDITKVISLNATVTTSRGTYHNCVQMEEWSPLENERETKYFAPGIGLVLEVNNMTGERTELVQIR